MAFDYTQASGLGTDTISDAVLGPPFLSIVQKGSPEFDETHPKFAEKRMDCRPGNIILESERVVLPTLLSVIPLAQLPHYTEWRPSKGGFVSNRALDVTGHRDYRKGVPGTPTEYKEYLGQNELVFTILYIILFKHDGVWKKGMIAFTNKQLKKARVWSKVIKSLKFADLPNIVPPMFAAAYDLSTAAESNEKGGWFGWNIGQAKLLNPVTDQALLEQAFEAAQKAAKDLPKTQHLPALPVGVIEAIDTIDTPY